MNNKQWIVKSEVLTRKEDQVHGLSLFDKRSQEITNSVSNGEDNLFFLNITEVY